MKTPFKLLLLLFLTTLSTKSFSQKIIKDYEPVKNDSLKIGIGENDFLPFIQKGYTLMLPENKKIKGVLKDFSVSKDLLSMKQSKKYATPGSEDMTSNVYSYLINFLSYGYKSNLAASHPYNNTMPTDGPA